MVNIAPSAVGVGFNAINWVTGVNCGLMRLLGVHAQPEIELEGTLPWRRGSTDKRPDSAVSVGDGPG
jgi:hypothetical protein